MIDTLQRSPLLPLIRQEVKRGLSRSSAFRALPPNKRAEIAHHTVKALHYITGGSDGASRPASVTFAGNQPLSGGLAGNKGNQNLPPTAGEEFDRSGAVAAEAGVDALANLIDRVDFPQFVAGLIEGVFNAIVDSSIKQMEAYAELVSNVSKSVDQYMKDNVSVNNARDYLLDKYPGHFELDLQDEGPKLKPREGYDEENLPDFQSDLSLDEPVRDLDESLVEEKLVPAARRRMAMDRQQLLATMVMMGVNRLVVTDGRIEASCIFELDTKDEVKKQATRKTTADWHRQTEARQINFGSRGRGGFLWVKPKKRSSWFRSDTEATQANFKVSTTNKDSSTAKVDLHARLGGKVNVNFKSDYFPMEKMVDVLQINRIRERSGVGAGAAKEGENGAQKTKEMAS